MPALVGAPKPITVRQAMKTGLSEFCAAASAAAISSGLWPSQRETSQFADAKRASWSVESDMETLPSIEMPLSSHSTMRLLELQVAGKRDGLLADALHQAAVARQHIGLVVDQVVAESGIEMALGDGEAHGIGNALAQRAGGGLDAGGMAEFRMARGLRAQLAEVLDLVQRHVLVAQEIEQRIHQHGAVAGGEDEAVPVGPVRIGGIEFEELGEQHGGDVGGTHGQARMARIGFLDRIHAEGPDGIGHGACLIRRILGHLAGIPRKRFEPGS